MDQIIDKLIEWFGNGRRNLSQTFENMTIEKYLRLTAVVGAYFLLRPYLLKYGAKIQERQHEKIYEDMEEKEAKARQAVISPNSLRGQALVPDDSDDDEDVEGAGGKGNTTGANWGKKARKRQRRTTKRALEADEKLRDEQDEESDKEIEQFLMETYGKQNLRD